MKIEDNIFKGSIVVFCGKPFQNYNIDEKLLVIIPTRKRFESESHTQSEIIKFTIELKDRRICALTI